MALATTTKDEFRNESPGYTGAVTMDPDGRQRAIAIAPGETIWLSEDEQVLTANAPRSSEDNPLANGSLVLVSEGNEIRNRRPLRPPPPQTPATADEVPVGPVTTPEETGAAPVPDGEAPEGTRPPTEEVGTPEAAVATRRRSRPKG